MDKKKATLAVDCLVVGGGFVGLRALQTLKAAGVKAVLVNDGAIGHGQAMHMHGFFGYGYFIPNSGMMRKLHPGVETWRSFFKTHGIAYTQEHNYVSLPPGHAEKQLAILDEAKLPYDKLAVSDQSSVGLKVDAGELKGYTLIRTRDLRYSNKDLIAAQLKLVEDLVIRGSVQRISAEAAPAGAGSADSKADAAADGSARFATVRLPDGSDVDISAKYFIVAAGLGSTAVLSRVVVSGEQAERQKELAARRAEQLRELNTNSPMHMITVRGPADLLPPGVQMVAGLEGAKMQYIGAIGHSDFSVDAKGQKHNLWFITPMGGEYRVFTKNAVPGTAEAEVVPTTVHDSVARALQVFPQLRAAAGKLQWMVYAGYKQEMSEELGKQYPSDHLYHVVPFAGLRNLVAVNPVGGPLALLAADDAAKRAIAALGGATAGASSSVGSAGAGAAGESKADASSSAAADGASAKAVQELVETLRSQGLRQSVVQAPWEHDRDDGRWQGWAEFAKTYGLQTDASKL